ncbi:MAG: hypothetical protein F6J98_25710 [Moorea sp. SIO4G2]|nr:hypothetical protein [Moorena sp. SIO4G2]
MQRGLGGFPHSRFASRQGADLFVNTIKLSIIPWLTTAIRLAIAFLKSQLNRISQ